MTKLTSANDYAPKPEVLDRVCGELLKKHEGDEITYTTCQSNGCQDLCVIRTHLRDGKVVAIETDTSVHQNTGREDEYCDFDDIKKGIFQRRACVRGRGMRSDSNSEKRIKYPMKRVGERGEGKFERISWDEALDTIAKWYTETREKYGPLSVYGDGMMGGSWEPFGQHLPGGALGAWACDSFEPSASADALMYADNQSMFSYSKFPAWVSGNAEAQTFFDSDLIILWGIDIAVNYQEFAYYLMLAKEMGKPIITIDPRYSWTAEAYATQHIYIRPGTDLAMMLAMCYVLFEEDLIDHEFVDKWVEPEGLQKFKDYVMGTKYNEEPKTPEWAAPKCGVPAETIWDLARLYGKSDAVYIRLVWAAARQYGGKEIARGFNCLQVLGGNIGKKGCAGSCTGSGTGYSDHYMDPYIEPWLNNEFGQYGATTCMEAEMWHRAILDRPKVDAHEISMDEYKEAIGCPKGVDAPNIHMFLAFPSMRNHFSGWYDSNERIEAIKMVDYFVLGHWNFEMPSVPYADILLPVAHSHLEGTWTTWGIPTASPGFKHASQAGVQNAFMYCHGGADPVGGYIPWIMHQIAIRLGIGDKVYGILEDCTNEETPEIIDKAAGMCYEEWRARPMEQGGGKGLKVHGCDEVPSWEEFSEYPLIQIPEDDYFVFMEKNRKEDIPLNTASGKIEFYSEALADADSTKMIFEQGAMTFGGNMPPIARYKDQPAGFLSKRTREYPLMMVTSHSFFRHHTAYDPSPWYRDEYRPSIWMSVSDAKQRGIKDGDMVMVESPTGQSIVTAYVTSRMTPGVVDLPFGRYYEPSSIKTDKMPEGIDMRGNCNLHIPSEFFDDGLGACLDNGLVEITRVDYASKASKMMEVK